MKRKRHKRDKVYLEEGANAIEKHLPDGTGFILLTMPFGEGQRLSYVSNIKREDAIALLKEWMIKCGAEEDWMQHLD